MGDGSLQENPLGNGVQGVYWGWSHRRPLPMYKKFRFPEGKLVSNMTNVVNANSVSIVNHTC